MREDAGHRHQREARDHARPRARNASPRRARPGRPGPRRPRRGPASPRRRRARPGRGRRAGATSKGSPRVEASPSSQRPRGGCSALSAKTESTTFAVEESPPAGAEGRDVRPAGPHVERLVDRQAGAVQREDDGQPGDGPHRHREPAHGPESLRSGGLGHARARASSRWRGSGKAAVERVRLCTMSARGASRRLGEIGGRSPEEERARVVPRWWPGRDSGSSVAHGSEASGGSIRARRPSSGRSGGGPARRAGRRRRAS